MNFMNHDCFSISQQLNIESIKSLTVYHDIYFIKKVIIKCDIIIEIFAIRVIPYSLRTIRELEEKNTNKNYI